MLNYFKKFFLISLFLSILPSAYGMDSVPKKEKQAAINRNLLPIFAQEEQYGDIQHLLASIQHVVNNDHRLQPAQPSNLNTAKQIFGNKQLNNN